MFSLVLFFLYMLCSSVKGVSIQGCGQVEENSTANITCQGYSGSVTWSNSFPGASTTVIGTCSSSCTLSKPSQSSFYSLTALSSSSSRLTLLPPVTTRAAGGVQYSCNTQACTPEIVAAAIVTKPSDSITRTDQGYTLHCQTNITKVYSSNGSYFCQFQFRGQSVDGSLTLQPTPSDITDRSDRTGSCDVTLPLPSDNGNDPCKVTVSPGDTQSSSDNIQIERPPPPSWSCSSDAVPENSDVTCTCNTDNVGKPGGRLRWLTNTNNNFDTEVKSGDYDVTSVTMTRRVLKSDSGVRKFRCVNNWNVNITAQADYTVTVAFGPDDVSIEGDTTFYTDTSGSKSLTLTCQTTAGPPRALTFAWNIPCDNGSDRQNCTFRPQPGNNGDDNRNITCTVTNTKNNNKRRQHSVVLDLKYPPTSPPHISGYTNYSVLYKGEELTLTCSVNGGDPPVTSVTLTCSGHDGTQSGRLTISPLSAGDHDTVCECSGQWARPSYYTLTAARTLNVYYPPSVPVISREDQGSLPYLEKDTVTLTCSVETLGNPAATVTWSGRGPEVTNRLLSFPASRGDDLRNLTCTASNAFTQHTGQPLRNVHTLMVYYGPDLSLSSLEGNICTTFSSVCDVIEGQRVHFRPEAVSNPDPQTYRWQTPPDSDLDLGTQRDLDIGSINRTQSGVYTVTVETEKPDPGDGRLPLRASHSLTVLVKYVPSDLDFMINDQRNHTVNESDDVTFVCRSNGRPTPQLRLTKSSITIKREEGGTLNLTEESTQLTYSMKTQCTNTRVYSCIADNGLGQTLQDTVNLYVNCGPRNDSSAAQNPPPVVNFRSGKAVLPFFLVAYPTPTKFSFSQTINGTKTSVGDHIKLTATCFTLDVEYEVTCNVNVRNAKGPAAEGLYALKVANDFGEAEFPFRVTVNRSDDDSGGVEKTDIAAAVGGGVAVAVAVIVIVGVALVVVKRRKGKTTSKKNKSPARRREEPEMIDNVLYGTAPGGRPEEEMIVNSLYGTSPGYGPQEAARNNARSRRDVNGYEDVELNTTPEPTPKTDSAELTGIYAQVNKAKKPSSKDAQQPQASTSGASGATTGKKKPDIKPKPGKKSAAEKPKNKAEKKKRNQDDTKLLRDGEYSNVSPLSMSPSLAEGSVYENYAFQSDGNAEKPGDPDEYREVNDDGLAYVTVAFTEQQRRKEQEPPPQRETTDYADIDWSRKAVPKSKG